MAKAKFTDTSPEFKSLHKNKSISDVIDYYSNPDSYSGVEDIVSLLDDITQFTTINSEASSNQESRKLLSLAKVISSSRKQNKKVIETISINSDEIKKAIKAEVTSQAPQKIQKKIPIQPTGTKYTVAPKKPTFVVAKSSDGVLDKVIEKVSVAKESESKITPVKKSEKTKTTKPKSTTKVEAAHRVVRTKEQVHEEKMVKVENERIKLQNQSLKIKNESEKIRTELLRLDFNKKQFEEEVRHRLEKEYTERVRLDAREFEAKNKEKEIQQKAKQVEASEKIAKGRISLARMKTKRQYDFMESDVGSTFYKDQNKTARSKQTAMNKRAKISLERAQLALENTKARNAIKEKQLEDRRMRDILRENSRREKERNSKISSRNKAIFEGIRESSPTLAYSYLGAQYLMKNRFATQKSTGDGGGGGFGGNGGGFGGGILGGILGSAATTGGVMAASKIGLFGRVLSAGKSLGNVFKTNPSSAKYVTGLASNGASATTAVGRSVPLAQRLGQAASAGGNAGKIFNKLPLLGGAITGALEYNDSGSAGRAVAVGAGSMAGAALGASIGAAAGTFVPIPGVGTAVGGLLGGIIGATLGESGMKSLTQKFLGKTEKQLNREKAYSGVSLSGKSFRDMNISKPSVGYGKQPDVAPLQPTTTSSSKQVMKVASGDESFFGKVYNSAYKHAVNAGAPNPEVLAHLAATQSSLETGNGKHAPNNNFFGIKGKGYKLQTKESINGNMQTVTESFRGYADLDSSVADYVSLMKRSKRYKDVFNAPSIDDAIMAQGTTGYATDPKYSQKLLSVKNQNLSRMIDAQKQLDSQTVSSKSTPTPVNVVSGGSSNVNNVQNTTVINQPDTDPTIRQHQFALLRVGTVL